MKIAILQMPVVMGQEEKNVNMAMRMIAEAANTNPDFIVLPECPFLGWLAENSAKSAEPVPGSTTHLLSRKAMGNTVYIVSGLTEIEESTVYNSAVIVDRRGSVCLKHRKINELDIGLKIYTRGTTLGVVETKFGRVGLSICADSWVPHITQTLAAMGARVIFSPCAWACEKGEEEENIRQIKEHYANRTKESNVYLIGANAVGEITEGEWKGKVLRGSSLVYGPGGKLIAEGMANEPQILHCNIDI